ncbi:Mu transposase C-terminal domain-containing protein [Variovorax sp. HW608]|uniref:Mu transposase C-terminal domain-containing protein n=1 Tax=Variovorax sp. HW608 TaxID=1034889 RepID=UPI0012FD48BD|nr:Mu transposase C-terminal domain-containing protein [Variovorax sp. HW608]
MVPGVDFVVASPNDLEQVIDLIARSDSERKLLRALPAENKSPATMSIFLERLRWLNALHSSGLGPFVESDLTSLEIRYLAQKYDLPVRSGETLAKWEKLGADAGPQLLPDFAARGGKGQVRGQPQVEELIAQAVVMARAGKIPLTTQAIKEKLETMVNTARVETGVPLDFPSDSTIRRRWMSQATPYEKAVAKVGKKKADRMFRPAGARARVTEPGLVYEFDDTDTKVFCVDDRTKLPWGRPWLTLGVDQHSAMPTGLSMDTIPLSSQSAVSALVHSIEVKDVEYLNSSGGGNGIKYMWEVSGYPTQAVFDNAVQNSLRVVSLNANVADASWARPYWPTDKREVEYKNGRLVTWLCKQPGFRGVRGDVDAIKEGLATATLSIDQLRQGILRWLLGVDANQPGKDGLTSRQRYLEYGRALKLARQIPPDTRRLRMLRMLALPKPVTWNRYGIRILGGLTYQDADLFTRYINRPGGDMKVNVRIDPEDLSSIYVIVPDSELVLVVDCCVPDYVEGLTLYGQKLILKLCREKKKQNPSIIDLWAARMELQTMTEQWVADKKVVLRKRAAAIKQSIALKKQKKEEEYAASRLETACTELDAVTLDQEDERWQLPIAD